MLARHDADNCGVHTLGESVEAVLAVIVGIALGSALAAAVALPLRRRRKQVQDRPERSRRLPFDTPEARQRAGFVAAAFAVSATVAEAAGWRSAAGLFMLGVLVLAVQAGTAALAARSARK
jgi:cytochrome c biogenesis protein CcdA